MELYGRRRGEAPTAASPGGSSDVLLLGLLLGATAVLNSSSFLPSFFLPWCAQDRLLLLSISLFSLPSSVSQVAAANGEKQSGLGFATAD